MTAILAFDTGTERCSVALLAGGRVRADAHGTGHGLPAASATLLPAIRRLLDEAGLAVADLDAIAFARGPGAFTGLRTAAAVAQGLALGAGKPVLPVGSLLAVSEDARRTLHGADGGPAASGDLRVWAVLDARMGEVYAALAVHRGGRWSEEVAPVLATPDAFAALAAGAVPADAIAGSGLAVLGDRAPAGPRRVDGATPHAEAVLALALAAWRRGEALDAALALPHYVRDKVAATEAERLAARRAAEGVAA
jgi:tRNA threonylcarbamoyladenosine biosynthesis protein TsaB